MSKIKDYAGDVFGEEYPDLTYQKNTEIKLWEK